VGSWWQPSGTLKRTLAQEPPPADSQQAVAQQQQLQAPPPTKRRRVNGPLQVVVTNLPQANTTGGSRQPHTGTNPNVQLYAVAAAQVQRHAQNNTLRQQREEAWPVGHPAPEELTAQQVW
jgi:hypothetical protein